MPPAVLLIVLLWLFPLLVCSSAEANFMQGGGKSCLGCHGSDFSANAGNNFYVAARGVDVSNATSISVRPGEIFEIDYYFETPLNSYNCVGVQATVPAGWAVATGSLGTAPTNWGNWNSNWDQSASGSWQPVLDLADSYTVRFATPIPWDHDGDAGGSNKRDVACDNGGDCDGDGINEDLDGVPHRMGIDLKVTASNTAGSYPLTIHGIYSETTKGHVGKTYTIVVDGTPPTVIGVSSTAASGTYKTADSIAVTVTFSEIVNVTGTPILLLETGTTDRNATYASGGGTNTLTFNYTVQAGDTSTDLDYVDSNSLALSGGTIRDLAGNDATLTLPGPGTAGSLGANQAIVIDGVAPTVSDVSSTNPNATYTTGNTLTLTLTFTESVNITGTPSLLLETGTTDWNATYASGSGTSTLTFSYTVQAGDTSADLDYVDTNSLNLSGGTIRDLAGNDATLTLPGPGTAGSLGANKNLIIDGTLPLLVVSKTVDRATASPGEALTYSVNYHNTGPGAAYNVVVVDTVPAFTTYVPNSLRIGSADSSYATAMPLTDAAGDDAGEFDGNTATFSFGPVLGDDGVPGSGPDEGKVYLRLLIN